jgi:hypothetical protein
MSARIPQLSQLYCITKNGISKRLRQLKWDELVSLGDFVMNDRLVFEPWEGPSGFQASAFIKPIYRQGKGRLPATRESK